MIEKLQALVAQWREDAARFDDGPKTETMERDVLVLAECADDLAAVIAETGWHPMETAPRDGRFVHLWVPGDERSDGYSETGSWVGAAGWDIGAAHQPDTMFTHWRPEFPSPESQS